MNETRFEFEAKGYAVLPDVMTHDEVRRYRNILDALSGETDRTEREDSLCWNMTDGVSRTPALWPLVLSQTLRKAVPEVLGNANLRYLEHSDVKVWRNRPASGWHRDSTCDVFGDGPDWDETRAKYQIVRVAIYLQPEEYGFKWGVIPGTHRREYAMSRLSERFWNAVLPAVEPAVPSRLPYLHASRGRLGIRTQKSRLIFGPPATPVWLSTRPTDCIVFDPRILHAGGNVKDGKYAVFFALGIDNEHGRRHLQHWGKERTDRGNESNRAELSRLLEESNMLLK